MTFYRTDLSASPSPIDELLNKYENEQLLHSPHGFPPPMVIQLRAFLGEEDIVRELRAENNRLINFLCRPEIILDLIRTTFELPLLMATPRNATTLQKSATSIHSPQPMSDHEQERDHHMKYAHVACELLTIPDNKHLTHTIAHDNNLMNCIFQYLDTPSGHLDAGVAINFSKLLIALLKAHHVQVISQMAKKGQAFVQSLVRHIDSIPIADLIVKILDGPEGVDNGNGPGIPVGNLYGSNPHFPPHNVVRKPTQEALDLLASADIFGRLATSFVKASTDAQHALLEDDDNHFNPADTHTPTASPEPATAATDPSKDASSDALLGKHPLSKEGSGSERPAQKPRSEEDDENATMTDKKHSEDRSDSHENDSDSSQPAAKGSEPTANVKGKTDSTEDSENVEPDTAEKVSVEARSVDISGKEGDQLSTTDSEQTSPAPAEGAQTAEPTSEPISEAEIAQENARRRRLREETMANVTSTILGLTERMLQLPALGCEIPEKLNVYATPIVISRLIDAGIYARCNGAMELPKVPGEKIEAPPASTENPADAAHVHRVESFSSGGSTALLHALKLAAELVSTQSNIYRDEEDAMGVDGLNVVSMGFNSHQLGGFQNSHNQKMMMMVMKASGGQLGQLGPVEGLNADGTNSSSTASSNSDQDGTSNSNSLFAQKRHGDRLISTDDLEAELEQRFERLAQMLDDGETAKISNNGPATAMIRRPLGSLRLMLAEFFVACIKQTSQRTVNRIMELEVPKTLLLLFDQYRWSSMLHGVVTSAVKECLLGGPARRSGRLAWFEAGLIPWMMDVWRRNSIEEGEMDTPKGGRCGYLGHLIHIGKELKSLLDEKDDNLLPSPSKTAGLGADDDASPIKKAKEFVTVNNPLGLPRQEEADQFRAFAEVMLEPALQREAKPLCGENGVNGGSGDLGDGSGRGPDEGEEATDVLVIGGIQYVEGPPRDDKLDEDEDEIKPVDTTAFEDLPQFGSEDVAEVDSPSAVDHDIPPEMRQRIGDAKKDSSQRKVDVGNVEDESKLDSGGGDYKRKKDSRRSSDTNDNDRKGGNSGSRAAAGDRADNKDSSSEDEGSYIAFVDDRKGKRRGSSNHAGMTATSPSSSSSSSSSPSSSPSERGSRSGGAGVSGSASSQYVTGKLASQMGKMNMVDDKDEAPSASLDGVVIEIDDEENDVIDDIMTPPPPPPPPAPTLGEEEASSDEDYETWESYSKKSMLAAASASKNDLQQLPQKQQQQHASPTATAGVDGDASATATGTVISKNR